MPWKRGQDEDDDGFGSEDTDFIPGGGDDDGDDEPVDAGVSADDGDDDAPDEDGDSGKGGNSDLRRLIAIGVAAVVAIALIGGGAWWFIGGEPERGGEPGVPWVELNVPPRLGAAGRAPNEGEAGDGKVIEVPATEVPAVTVASYGGIPERSADNPLPAVPDAGLIEESPHGPLPMIGVDGRESWKVYARPTPLADDRPQIAIIVWGLGLSAAATEAAIRLLPAGVTLAFDPYGKGLDDWAPLARQYGHEFLIYVPSEPREFPIVDPGPFALETVLDPAENLRRLDFVLSRVSGYVGVVTGTGSFFTAEEDHVRPILDAIKSRGLMIVDGGGSEEPVLPEIASEIKLPRVINDLVLDLEPSKAAIDRQLARLEEISRDKAVAVAIAAPYPSTIGRIVAWAASLEQKNLSLVPVSSLADKQLFP